MDNIFMKEINQFLASRSNRTRSSYGWMLERLMEWAETNQVDPTAMDADLVNVWLDAQQGWGKNTRRLAICAIRAFYRWWKGDLHPVLTVKLYRVQTDPQRVLTPRQAVLLLSCCDPETPSGARDLAILTMMMDTGLREFEVCALETGRLCLDERRISVIVKGGHWGRAVFSAVTAEHLVRWLPVRLGIRKKNGLPESGPLFCKIFDGEEMQPATMRELFDRLSVRCGFRVSAHDLRRTFATLSTKAGAPTRVTMAAGRWSSMEVFSRYVAGISAEDMEPWFPVRNLAEGKLT